MEKSLIHVYAEHFKQFLFISNGSENAFEQKYITCKHFSGFRNGQKMVISADRSNLGPKFDQIDQL